METVAAGGGGGSLGYADSVDSSPRSRGGDSWDEPPFASSAAGRLRLMCSYGGRIVPRPTDKSLCYLGGETRIVVVDRHSSLADLSAKLSRTLLGGRPFSLKYQLPNEDLDSLISVATDEDLDNMIDEYDRILASSAAAGAAARSFRLRLFLFPSKPEASPTSSIGSLLDDSKSETWFVDALNSAMGGMGIDGLPRGLSSDSASVNCLLGLDDDSSVHSRGGGAIAAAGGGGGAHSERLDQLLLPQPDSSGKHARQGQDVHSVPNSPMLDTASSFGSASSAPSLSSLPPIRVRPDDRPPDLRIAGLDDHFAHMNLSAAGGGQRPDDDFKEPAYAPQHQPPTPIPLSASSGSSLTISPTENPSRVFSSDDEKSDHGGIGKPPQQQPSKPTLVEAAIFDSGSRSMHLNASPDPKRELVSSVPSYRVPIPATDATGYQLPSSQPEQFQQQQLHPQLHQQHQQQQLHPQLHQQHQQQQLHPQLHQQHQQQQYIPANPHYIHHPATGGVIPVPTYFPMAAHTIQQSPEAHPYNPQIPMYYYPVQQTPSYNLAAVQPGSADQAHSYAGMGYHVVQQHHLSQSPAAMVNYGYEYAVDHTQPQMYYSQLTSSSLGLAPQRLPVNSGVAPADVKSNRAS